MTRTRASIARLGTRLELVGVLLVIAILGAPQAGPSQPAPATPTGTVTATDPSQLPEELRDIGWEQKIGDSVDLDVALVDESGRSVRLGDYFGEKRPVLLAPVYYHCPMLCSLVLEGVIRNLMPLSLTPGEDFEVVAVSFDPRDTPQSATEIREQMLERYRREEADGGFHFLSGEEEDIAPLMEQLGVQYAFDEKSGVYRHAGGIVLLTPEGEISRYFFGIDFPAKDIRLGLIEASEGRIGNVIDQVLLYCYRYDPVTGKYSAVAMNIIRLGGVVTVILLFGFITLALLRERRNRLADA